jgi:hypothetical protein
VFAAVDDLHPRRCSRRFASSPRILAAVGARSLTISARRARTGSRIDQRSRRAGSPALSWSQSGLVVGVVVLRDQGVVAAEHIVDGLGGTAAADAGRA